MVVGGSTEKVDQKAYNRLERDTEEIVSWRSNNQEESDDIWKNGGMKKDVLGTYKWRKAKKEPKRKKRGFGMEDGPESQEISGSEMG